MTKIDLKKLSQEKFQIGIEVILLLHFLISLYIVRFILYISVSGYNSFRVKCGFIMFCKNVPLQFL